MKKVYAEIGIGNGSFLSTEFETKRKEYRINKLIMPKKLNEFYIRIWIIKLVIIISFFNGIFFKKKDKCKFKFLIGFGGKE
jgi:hypothetical protein